MKHRNTSNHQAFVNLRRAHWYCREKVHLPVTSSGGRDSKISALTSFIARYHLGSSMIPALTRGSMRRSSGFVNRFFFMPIARWLARLWENLFASGRTYCSRSPPPPLRMFPAGEGSVAQESIFAEGVLEVRSGEYRLRRRNGHHHDAKCHHARRDLPGGERGGRPSLWS